MLRAQMDDKPFRLVVSIIRGTNAGRALELMARGITCVAETRKEGMELVEKYLDCAAAILEHVSSGIVFGMVALMDTNTGSVEFTAPLVGSNPNTTLGDRVPVEARRNAPPNVARHM